MQKKNWIAALLLALVVAVSFSACGIIELKDTVKSPWSSAELKGRQVEDVEIDLRELGLENIVMSELKTTDAERDGEVKDVSMRGKQTFNAGDAWVIDEEITISYYRLDSFVPEIEVSVEGEDGWPEFVVKTNLPNKIELALTLTDEDGYNEQKTVTVQDGEARSQKFVNDGYLALAGDYILTVEMRMGEQGYSARSAFGTDGDVLSGDLVFTDEATGQMYIHYECPYTSPYDKEEIDRIKNMKSVYDIVGLLNVSMAANYGSNYSVKQDDNMLIVSVWNDGVAAGAALAQQGNAEMINAWMGMSDNMVVLCDSVRVLLDQNGHTLTTAVVNVVNDANRDNLLLTVKDGAVVYDCVYGIDLLNIGY